MKMYDVGYPKDTLLEYLDSIPSEVFQSLTTTAVDTLVDTLYSSKEEAKGIATMLTTRFLAAGYPLQWVVTEVETR